MFDPTKPVMWKGKPVRIICTNAEGDWPIIFLSKSGSREVPLSAFADGSVPGFLSDPLINVPERTSQFINIYKDSGRSAFVFKGLEDAQKNAYKVMWTGVTVEVILEDGVPVSSVLHTVNKESE